MELEEEDDILGPFSSNSYGVDGLEGVEELLDGLLQGRHLPLLPLLPPLFSLPLLSFSPSLFFLCFGFLNLDVRMRGRGRESWLFCKRGS